MYLFKREDGTWIFGATDQSECPSGIFRIEPNVPDSVTIRYVQRDIAFMYAEPIDSFKDASGTVYETLDALLAASRGFFSNENKAVEIQEPGLAGVIDVSAGDFAPAVNCPFKIKNDGDDTVTLEVKYAKGDAWIQTKFKPGWNEDLVKAVKQNAAVLDLKWGVK